MVSVLSDSLTSKMPMGTECVRALAFMLPGAASGPGPPLHILGWNKTAATLHSH